MELININRLCSSPVLEEAEDSIVNRSIGSFQTAEPPQLVKNSSLPVLPVSHVVDVHCVTLNINSWALVKSVEGLQQMHQPPAFSEDVVYLALLPRLAHCLPSTPHLRCKVFRTKRFRKRRKSGGVFLLRHQELNDRGFW